VKPITEAAKSTRAPAELSAVDKNLLAVLTPADRDTVLSVVRTYPSISVASAIERCRLDGM
jgi:hypothetical protein